MEYNYKCPACRNTITINWNASSVGEMYCPYCGERFRAQDHQADSFRTEIDYLSFEDDNCSVIRLELNPSFDLSAYTFFGLEYAEDYEHFLLYNPYDGTASIESYVYGGDGESCYSVIETSGKGRLLIKEIVEVYCLKRYQCSAIELCNWAKEDRGEAV